MRLPPAGFGQRVPARAYPPVRLVPSFLLLLAPPVGPFVRRNPMPGLQHTILLIEDDPRDEQVVREALERTSDSEFRLEWVTCALGRERSAAPGQQQDPVSNGIAAERLSLHLPDVAGIDAFDKLFAATPHIPIVIVSSSQDAAIAPSAIPARRSGFPIERASRRLHLAEGAPRTN
jgi:CheY-like chemotaxis protein